jgi:hypothetical protein
VSPLPDGNHPRAQGSAAVGADLVSGSFNYQFQYTVSGLHLHELNGKLGQLDILSDPAFQLQFPTSPGAAQGGLMVNYLHWQLPQLGPVIVNLAVQGAANHLQAQGWQLSHNLNADIRLARAQWLVLSGSGGFNVNFFGSGGARVEPTGQITLGVEFLLEQHQVVRQRQTPAAGPITRSHEEPLDPSLVRDPLAPLPEHQHTAQDVDQDHLADAHHRLQTALYPLETADQLHDLSTAVLESLRAAHDVVHNPQGTIHVDWNHQLANAYHAWEHLNAPSATHDQIIQARDDIASQFHNLSSVVGGWRGQRTGPQTRAQEGEHYLTGIGEALTQAAHQLAR